MTMLASLRRILALPVGIVCASSLALVVESVGHRWFFRATPRFDTMTMDVPVGAFWMVLLAHTMGTFAGAWVARRLGIPHGRRLGLLVGLFMLALAIANLLAFAHPAWFAVLDLVLIGAAAWVATRTERNAVVK